MGRYTRPGEREPVNTEVTRVLESIPDSWFEAAAKDIGMKVGYSLVLAMARGHMTAWEAAVHTQKQLAGTYTYSVYQLYDQARQLQASLYKEFGPREAMPTTVEDMLLTLEREGRVMVPTTWTREFRRRLKRCDFEGTEMNYVEFIGQLRDFVEPGERKEKDE
jgi:hypothetical protein